MLTDYLEKSVLGKIALVLLASWLITGCSGEKPLTIGYVGTSQGLKGAELAAERVNKTGGIRDREVRIVRLDSDQGLTLTDDSISYLDDEDAMAIIDNSGAPAEQIPSGRIPFIVKTGTAHKDKATGSENFVIIDSPLETTAPDMADYLWRKGVVSVSIIVDAADQPYNNSWLTAFRSRYELNKGVVLKIEVIRASNHAPLDKIVDKAVMKETAGLVIIADYEKSLEICRLAKLAHQDLTLALADPASTWRIIDEEAPAVQNIILTRYLNNTNDEVAFQSFMDSFQDNFETGTPTFSAAAAYDATNMLLVAIKGKKRLKSVRESFLGISSAQGSLGMIENKNGKFLRTTFLARKSGKSYLPLVVPRVDKNPAQRPAKGS